MKPNGPIRKCVQGVCHDTLPWLISFSLDGPEVSDRRNQQEMKNTR